MRCEHEENRKSIENAYNKWRLALMSFDSAPPCEASIAALELEAAERRYMLALYRFKNSYDFSKEEGGLCPRSTFKFPISASRAER